MTNVMLRDLDIVLPNAADGRPLEVVADLLGSKLADTSLVCVLLHSHEKVYKKLFLGNNFFFGYKKLLLGNKNKMLTKIQKHHENYNNTK